MNPIPPSENLPAASGTEPALRPWSRFASASRRALAQTAREDESAPLGFSTRIASRWVAQRRDQAAILWQRWSFRAAGFSAALAVLGLLAVRPVNGGRAPESPILPYPGLEVPLPTEIPSES